jgi:photosystem II stability/assembly factor-like uncharacterized protein
VRHFLLALTLFAAAAPRQDAWKILGPGGGGAMFYPTVSPHDPKLVLVACDMTGSYVSRDGGDTWNIFNLGGTTRAFAFDPVDPKTMYAVTGALWRSTDTGATWHMVYPDPKQVTGSSMDNDHAGERLLVGGKPAALVRAFAVHPRDSKRLYILTQDQLLTSADRGATWSAGAGVQEGARKLYVSAAGEVHGVGKDSQDVSARWTRDGKLVVYEVTGAGTRVSDDAGATWRPIEFRARVRAIATSLQNPDTAYLSYNGLDGQAFGVAKTTDRGRTWTPVWRETRDEPAKNLTTAWLEEKFGSGWAGNPLTMGVSPTDPNLVFGTDFGRMTRSTDGGATWKAVYSRRVAGAGWESTGLDVTTCYGIHFDPFDRNRMIISYTDIGAFRSEDGGRSWLSATNGIERRWTNTTYWLAFDPKVRGRVWGVFSGIHDLPRPKMWRSQPVARYNGGVGVSNDGGAKWTMLKDAGMPDTAATHIVLDPNSPVDARTLYVAAYGRGVYKSTDGGKSWALKNDGLPAHEPFAWRIERDRTGGLYLIIARRSDDGSIGTPDDGALFYSSDGAEHWTRVPLPEGVNGPNGLAIHPANPKRLYLAAWGRSRAGPKGGGGIFSSDDAGRTWKPIFERDQHVYDVTIDPKNPNVLYACGFESAAWRSADAGATWQRIPGYNFKWGHRVIPDPYNAGMVYITTFGGSVWYGPAGEGGVARVGPRTI